MKKLGLVILGIALVLGVLVGAASAETAVTFINRTGVDLNIFYDVRDSGPFYCDEMRFAGVIPAGGYWNFSVPSGEVAIVNFKTCSYPCGADCPFGNLGDPFEDITVTLRGNDNWRGRHYLN